MFVGVAFAAAAAADADADAACDYNIIEFKEFIFIRSCFGKNGTKSQDDATQSMCSHGIRSYRDRSGILALWRNL